VDIGSLHVIVRGKKNLAREVINGIDHNLTRQDVVDVLQKKPSLLQDLQEKELQWLVQRYKEPIPMAFFFDKAKK
jgi:hypothetical protein